MRTPESWRDKVLPKILERFPQRLQKDMENIPKPKAIEVPVESVYIYGQVGSGKTVYAAFMMLAEMEHRYLTLEDASPRDCVIRSVPELLFEFKQTYDKNSIVTEQDMMDAFGDSHLLVLDDFGVEKISDWAYQLLYMLINRRYSNLKTTIFTSNFDLEQIAQQLGDDRLTSRIQHMCVVLKFEDDYRV